MEVSRDYAPVLKKSAYLSKPKHKTEITDLEKVCALLRQDIEDLTQALETWNNVYRSRS